MPTIKLRRSDLIEPELSYKIVGALYRVFNELGPGLLERYYDNAAAVVFTEIGLTFKRQPPIPLNISGKTVGRYFADFVVENKVVVELKKGDRINRRHAAQLLAYLKTTNLKLGMLVYFGNGGVFFKRIINK